MVHFLTYVRGVTEQPSPVSYRLIQDEDRFLLLKLSHLEFTLAESLSAAKSRSVRHSFHAMLLA